MSRLALAPCEPAAPSAPAAPAVPGWDPTAPPCLWTSCNGGRCVACSEQHRGEVLTPQHLAPLCVCRWVTGLEQGKDGSLTPKGQYWVDWSKQASLSRARRRRGCATGCGARQGTVTLGRQCCVCRGGSSVAPRLITTSSGACTSQPGLPFSPAQSRHCSPLLSCPGRPLDPMRGQQDPLGLPHGRRGVRAGCAPLLRGQDSGRAEGSAQGRLGRR